MAFVAFKLQNTGFFNLQIFFLKSTTFWVGKKVNLGFLVTGKKNKGDVESRIGQSKIFN